MIIDVSDVESIIDDEISDYLLNTSIQIFKQSNFENKPLGCGVLFEFEENYFIITAAHVLKGNKRAELYIRTDNFLVSLEFETLHFISEIEDNRHDKVDLGAIRISSPDLIASLKVSNKFINLEDLSFDSLQLKSNTIRSTNPDYLMFGFPESQTKLKYKNPNHWNVKALYFKCGLSSIALEDVKNSGFANHLFFATGSNDGIDILTRQRQKLPQLFGMSGCGLWAMDKFDVKTGRIKVKLCGIFYGVEKQLLVFTKIDLAVVLIRETFELKKLPSLGHPLKWKRLHII